MTVRHGRARFLGGSTIVAATHFVVWLLLFRAAFAAIDAGRSLDPISAIALNVLGAPLMFVLYIPPSAVSASSRWWGDTSQFIVALAVPNSLLWGFAVVWVFRLLKRHRRARPDAA